MLSTNSLACFKAYKQLALSLLLWHLSSLILIICNTDWTGFLPTLKIMCNPCNSYSHSGFISPLQGSHWNESLNTLSLFHQDWNLIYMSCSESPCLPFTSVFSWQICLWTFIVLSEWKSFLVLSPSQVCRVAYEIMQMLHPDASSFFYSLDDIYYFGGQNAHNQIAIYPHQPRNSEDIPLEPGDVIGVAGNHWDGYSKGINRKLGRTGLYPSYKVKEKIETVKYPTYPEADKLLTSQKK